MFTEPWLKTNVINGACRHPSVTDDKVLLEDNIFMTVVEISKKDLQLCKFTQKLYKSDVKHQVINIYNS